MKIKNLGEVILAIKSHLEEYLNEQGIETKKGNFNCIFPDHKDEHPSCHLYKKDNGDHKGHCFSCSRSFDLIDACCILEGKPRTGKGWATETIKYLADKYGEEIQIEELTEEDTYEINTFAAYKAATELLQTHFNGEERQQPIKKEIERRQWNENTLREYNIGCVLDYNEFINKLKEQGFSITFLREIDIARKDIFSIDNLIFTWKDEHGRPVGFTARNLNYEEEVREAKEGTQKPRKYNNIRTTGLKCNIFRKNSRLYGIDTALKTAPPLWIFEGQSDVITAKQAGLHNCVCFSGGNLSEDQIHLVKKLGIFKIIICTDADKAGKEKLQAILDHKLSGHKDIDVKVVILPDGEDPDSFIRNNGIDEFKKLNQWTAFEWRLNQFEEIDDPVDICKAMIQFIAKEASPVRREQLCRTLADRIDYPLKTIQDELAIILDSKAYEASRERDSIITKLIHELRSSPTDADEVIRAAQTDLVDLSIKFKGDSFGIDDCLQAVIDQKQEEECKTNKYEGFSLGDDLRPLEDNLQGDWTKDVCMFVGGKPSTGKCLEENTEILLSNGEYKKIKDIFRDKDKYVMSMNKDYKIEEKEISNWIYSGKLKCLKITTNDGIEITASKTHPFFTEGLDWKEIKDIQCGDKIAIASNIRILNPRSPIKEEEAIILGSLLSEGCLTKGVGFCNTDEELIHIFKTSIENMFGKMKWRKEKLTHFASNEWHNKALDYLKDKGLYKTNSHTKFIPNEIFLSSEKRIGQFLGMFWACDGWTSFTKEGGFEIGISLCNKTMIKQIRSLLLRFGIKTVLNQSTSSYTGSDKRFNRYTLSIREKRSIVKFHNNIRIPLSYKKNNIKNYLKKIDNFSREGNSFTFPGKFWKIIKKNCEEKDISFRNLMRLICPMHKAIVYKEDKDRFDIIPRYCPTKGCGIQKEVLLSIGTILNNRELINLANGDIYFSEVIKIEEIGEKNCYDLTVPETNNFIANDFITHNSGLMSKIAYEIATRNEDTTVIYHSIDDTRAQIIPRLVCIAEGSKKLSINQIRNPSYWGSKPQIDYKELIQRRNKGYSKVIELVKQGRLIVKDVTNGKSMSFIEGLLQYHKSRSSKVLYILDNFHKLDWFSHIKDERVRWKKTSERYKELIEKYHASGLATVEYPKIPPGQKPNDNNIAECAQILYDANFTVHLYSELADIPDSCSTFHTDTDYRGETTILPRVEAIIGKNKIASTKNGFFLDFWPEASDYRYVDLLTVIKEQQESKQFKGQEKSGGDPLEHLMLKD